MGHKSFKTSSHCEYNVNLGGKNPSSSKQNFEKRRQKDAGKSPLTPILHTKFKITWLPIVWSPQSTTKNLLSKIIIGHSLKKLTRLLLCCPSQVIFKLFLGLVGLISLNSTHTHQWHFSGYFRAPLSVLVEENG